MSSTCSGLGKCSSEHSTCSSRFCRYIKLVFSINMYFTQCLSQFAHLFLVVQCDNVLLWSLFRLDISLQWGALCQLLTQVSRRQRRRRRRRQNRGTYVNFLPRADILLTVLFQFSAFRLEVLKRLLFVFSIIMRLYFVFQRPHRDSWLHLQHICDRLLGS